MAQRDLTDLTDSELHAHFRALAAAAPPEYVRDLLRGLGEASEVADVDLPDLYADSVVRVSRALREVAA